MRTILASTSPRRREILALLGLPFEVIAPDYEEVVVSHRPVRDEVLEFGLGKARSVAKDNPQSLVIGSDTMILIEGQKIGKPGNSDEAKAMLSLLAGKNHSIFTSVAIVDGLGGPGLAQFEEVSVKMRDYGAKELDDYLACNESLDKAGAYSIQGRGRSLIEAMEGDYLAAVGLPLKPIADYLQSRGLAAPLDVDRLYSDKCFLNWRSF